MQARYYNAEWGRFINSDGVIGQTGELLGHNMFAYCKNNPVNMSDENGDRPEFSGTGHDTGDDLVASLAYQKTVAAQTIKRYAVSTSNGGNSIIHNVSSVLGTTQGNVASSTADSFVDRGLSNIVSKVTKPIGYLFSTPKIAKISDGIGKVGIFNSISFGITEVDEWMNYNIWDASGRTLINMAVLGGGIYGCSRMSKNWAQNKAGFIAGTTFGVGVGLGLNWLGDKIKSIFFDKK